MLRKNNLNIRLISLVLAGAFLLQEASFAAPMGVVAPAALPIEALLQNPHSFEAPLNFSTLKEVHKGTKDVLIINIEDPHSNFSGQENISKALCQTMGKYGVSLVMVEGSSKDSTLDPLKKLAPSKTTLERAAKKFLMEGKISGEEYLNLTCDMPMKIMGLEDRSLYFDSVQNYAALADKREATLAYLGTIEKALDKLKTKYYPNDLLELEKIKDDQSFDKRFELLSKLSPNLEKYSNLEVLKSLKERESKFDFNAVNLEQAALLDEINKKGGQIDFEALSQEMKESKLNKASSFSFFQKTFNIAEEKGVQLSVFPSLSLYRDYLKEFSTLDLSLVLQELKMLEDEVYVQALKDQDSRMTRAIDQYVTLLETAYHIQMTTDDFEKFAVNAPDFPTAPYLAFINRKLADLGYFEEVVSYEKFLEQGKESLGKFYKSVSKRDLAFLQNTERIMKEKNQKVAFLISGGYHTQHLTDLYKEKGYSYIVLTPHVTKETNQAKYEKELLSPIRKDQKKIEVSGGSLKGASSSDVRAQALVMNEAGLYQFVQEIANVSDPNVAQIIADLSGRPDLSGTVGTESSVQNQTVNFSGVLTGSVVGESNAATAVTTAAPQGARMSLLDRKVVAFVAAMAAAGAIGVTYKLSNNPTTAPTAASPKIIHRTRAGSFGALSKEFQVLYPSFKPFVMMNYLVSDRILRTIVVLHREIPSNPVDLEKWDADAYRVLVGDFDRSDDGDEYVGYEEIPVTSAYMMRDGGSTVVNTEEHSFKIDLSFENRIRDNRGATRGLRKPPTFDGNPAWNYKMMGPGGARMAGTLDTIILNAENVETITKLLIDWIEDYEDRDYSSQINKNLHRVFEEGLTKQLEALLQRAKPGKTLKDYQIEVDADASASYYSRGGDGKVEVYIDRYSDDPQFFEIAGWSVMGNEEEGYDIGLSVENAQLSNLKKFVEKLVALNESNSGSRMASVEEATWTEAQTRRHYGRLAKESLSVLKLPSTNSGRNPKTGTYYSDTDIDRAFNNSAQTKEEFNAYKQLVRKGGLYSWLRTHAPAGTRMAFSKKAMAIVAVLGLSGETVVAQEKPLWNHSTPEPAYISDMYAKDSLDNLSLVLRNGNLPLEKRVAAAKGLAALARERSSVALRALDVLRPFMEMEAEVDAVRSLSKEVASLYVSIATEAKSELVASQALTDLVLMTRNKSQVGLPIINALTAIAKLRKEAFKPFHFKILKEGNQDWVERFIASDEKMESVLDAFLASYAERSTDDRRKIGTLLLTGYGIDLGHVSLAQETRPFEQQPSNYSGHDSVYTQFKWLKAELGISSMDQYLDILVLASDMQDAYRFAKPEIQVAVTEWYLQAYGPFVNGDSFDENSILHIVKARSSRSRILMNPEKKLKSASQVLEDMAKSMQSGARMAEAVDIKAVQDLVHTALYDHEKYVGHLNSYWTLDPRNAGYIFQMSRSAYQTPEALLEFIKKTTNTLQDRHKRFEKGFGYNEQIDRVVLDTIKKLNEARIKIDPGFAEQQKMEAAKKASGNLPEPYATYIAQNTEISVTYNDYGTTKTETGRIARITNQETGYPIIWLEGKFGGIYINRITEINPAQGPSQATPEKEAPRGFLVTLNQNEIDKTIRDGMERIGIKKVPVQKMPWMNQDNAQDARLLSEADLRKGLADGSIKAVKKETRGPSLPQFVFTSGLKGYEISAGARMAESDLQKIRAYNPKVADLVQAILNNDPVTEKALIAGDTSLEAAFSRAFPFAIGGTANSPRLYTSDYEATKKQLLAGEALFWEGHLALKNKSAGARMALSIKTISTIAVGIITVAILIYDPIAFLGISLMGLFVGGPTFLLFKMMDKINPGNKEHARPSFGSDEQVRERAPKSVPAPKIKKPAVTFEDALKENEAFVAQANKLMSTYGIQKSSAKIVERFIKMGYLKNASDFPKYKALVGSMLIYMTNERTDKRQSIAVSVLNVAAHSDSIVRVLNRFLDETEVEEYGRFDIGEQPFRIQWDGQSYVPDRFSGAYVKTRLDSIVIMTGTKKFTDADEILNKFSKQNDLPPIYIQPEQLDEAIDAFFESADTKSIDETRAEINAGKFDPGQMTHVFLAFVDFIEKNEVALSRTAWGGVEIKRVLLDNETSDAKDFYELFRQAAAKRIPQQRSYTPQPVRYSPGGPVHDSKLDTRNAVTVRVMADSEGLLDRETEYFKKPFGLLVLKDGVQFVPKIASGARMAEEKPSIESIQTKLGVKDILPVTAARLSKDVDSILDLIALVAASHQDRTTFIQTDLPQIFAGLKSVSGVNGSVSVQLVDPLDPDKSIDNPVTFTFSRAELDQVRRKFDAHQKALNEKIVTALAKNQAALDAVRDVAAEENLTFRLLQKAALALRENKHVMVSVAVEGVKGADDKMIQDLAGLRVKMLKLQKDTGGKLSVYIQLVDQSGSPIESYKGFRSDAAPTKEVLAGSRLGRTFTGVLRSALVTAAIAAGAGYLPTEAVSASADSYTIAATTPRIQTAVLGQIVDSSNEDYLQALKTITQSRSIGPRQGAMVQKVPDNATVEIFIQEGLVVHVIKLSAEMYQAYLQLTTTGSSA